MNSLPQSNATKNWHRHRSWRCPIPAAAVYVLLALFTMAFCVFTFFLIAVHNALFFLLLLSISSLIAAFLLWNSTNAALSFFLRSLPHSDLSSSVHGQLVKITGVSSHFLQSFFFLFSFFFLLFRISALFMSTLVKLESFFFFSFSFRLESDLFFSP